MNILDLDDFPDEFKKKISKQMLDTINQNMIDMFYGNISENYQYINDHSLKIHKYVQKKDIPFNPANYIDPIELTLK